MGDTGGHMLWLSAYLNLSARVTVKLNKPCIIDAVVDGDIYPPMSIFKT